MNLNQSVFSGRDGQRIQIEPGRDIGILRALMPLAFELVDPLPDSAAPRFSDAGDLLLTACKYLEHRFGS